MIDNRPWIALYSHTGSEICNISTRLSKQPDLVITNNSVGNDKLTCQSVKTSPRPAAVDYRTIFDTVDSNPIITLHGWMRVVPAEICNEYEIYNLHPGLITQYPELKGKDPQERVFNMLNIPQYVGCVIHRAVAEVDSGEVIMSRKVLNTHPSAQILSHALHDMAGDMWVDFFEKGLYNNE